jgi:lauroyl/myristoyl acyltransferase
VLQRLLAVLPRRPAERAVGLLGIAYAVVRRDPLRRARIWAGRQAATPRDARALALAVLANAARNVANEALFVAGPVRSVRGRITLEGGGRAGLLAETRGAIVLVFHLGPPVSGLALRLLGHRVVMAGAGGHPVGWPLRHAAWARFVEPGEDPFVLWPRPADRVAGLYRVRRRLLDGAIVVLPADGDGATAFHVALPGGDLPIASGWLALRRHTGVPTFPALAHPEAGGIVVTIHPALPVPDDDPDADRRVCQTTLTAILADYVRRFPAECGRLALARP